jgi:outer membrane lipoprotein-sorting protein
MIATMLLAAMLTADTPDPIAAAQAEFAQLESYRVTVHSSPAHGVRDVIHYSYRKPGFIRMDFVQPHHGAALVYNPHSGKVRLWPFGPGTFPVLNLSPSNALIRDSGGHQVDQSDVGALLSNIRRLQQGGTTQVVGEEQLQHGSALHLSITGGPGQSVSGVHRYQVWLERGQGFPRLVKSYDTADVLLETVHMDDVEFDVAFRAHFFDP